MCEGKKKGVVIIPLEDCLSASDNECNHRNEVFFKDVRIGRLLGMWKWLWGVILWILVANFRDIATCLFLVWVPGVIIKPLNLKFAAPYSNHLPSEHLLLPSWQTAYSFCENVDGVRWLCKLFHFFSFNQPMAGFLLFCCVGPLALTAHTALNPPPRHMEQVSPSHTLTEQHSSMCFPDVIKSHYISLNCS